MPSKPCVSTYDLKIIGLPIIPSRPTRYVTFLILSGPGLQRPFIEVQSGGYLGEDDIVRFEDTYGRG